MAEEIKKPTRAEVVAPFNAALLIKALNEARVAAGLKPVTSNFANWKQWVEAVEEFDSGGLRDVVNTYGYAIDDIKNHLDAFDEREATHYRELKAAVEGLSTGSPFPFEG